MSLRKRPVDNSGADPPTKRKAGDENTVKSEVAVSAPVSQPSSGPEKQKKEKSDYAEGTNWVSGGLGDSKDGLALIFLAPFLCNLLAYLTSENVKKGLGLRDILAACFERDCANKIWTILVESSQPSWAAASFVFYFMLVAFILEFIPGKIERGPETLTGHVPKYVDNGVRHCFVFSLLFFCGSKEGGSWIESNVGLTISNPFGEYRLGIFYEIFVPMVAFLNIFGVIFCFFLMLKGRFYPSTQDASVSGSLLKDYLWGTELYPRIRFLPKSFAENSFLSQYRDYFHGWDLKRFINCRFSMTFWMLAGLSFAHKSFANNENIDWGLLLSAISQYIYLVKFFWWEMGYMRSIDIIVDRAGFEIQWGCLVWVPSIYTLHTRFLVRNESGLGLYQASLLFIVSLLGVLFNYLADRERDVFRASNGKALVWGKPAKYIEAEYFVIDRNTGQKTAKKSLLLYSGFWGVARHFQYTFELLAAWSWCLMANPLKNGIIPMSYCVFLTWLLINRAVRDHEKCQRKYGKYWDEYCKHVPYKILPGIF